MLRLVLGLFSALLDMFRTRSPMFDRLQRRNNSHGHVKIVPTPLDERRPPDLRVLLVVVLLGADPSADEVISHGVCQRQVVVAVGGDIAVLDDRVVDVPTERLLHVRHVLDERDATHGDLLAPVLVRLRLGSHRNNSRTDLHRADRRRPFQYTTPPQTLSHTPRVPKPTPHVRPSTVSGWAGHLHTPQIDTRPSSCTPPIYGAPRHLLMNIHKGRGHHFFDPSFTIV